MIRRRNLRTRTIKMFILDEADEMLNRGLFEFVLFCFVALVKNAEKKFAKLFLSSFRLNLLIPFFSGFKEQIYDVYRFLPPGTQVVLVSATLPHEVLEMTSKFMTEPIRILVKRFVLWLFFACLFLGSLSSVIVCFFDVSVWILILINTILGCQLMFPSVALCQVGILLAFNLNKAIAFSVEKFPVVQVIFYC